MRALILALVLISGTAYADEVITGFDTQKDLPILNEELRKLDQANLSLSTRVTALEDAPAVEQVVVAVSNYQTGEVSTGTTTIPGDDSIPQSGEGDEYMTLAHTPATATNKLRIDALANVSTTANGYPIIMALFKNSDTDALAATMDFVSTSGAPTQISMSHYMTAATTSTITFKVRIGCTNAGTTTFNGVAGGRYFGGTMASSITVTEVNP